MTSTPSRRREAAAGILAAAAAAGGYTGTARAQSAPSEDRVGFQKGSAIRVLARKQQVIEARHTFGPVMPAQVTQQQLADVFRSAGIVPRKFTVSEVVRQAHKR